MTNAKGYTVHPDSWAAHLDDDETLIWTGDPIKAFRWHTQGWFASMMFVAQITIGLFVVSVISMAIMTLSKFHPILILGIHLAPGLAILTGIALWTWAKRRTALYALTNKRAIVALRFPYKHLKSYPIYKDKPITVGRTSPKSLYFAHTRRQVKFTSYMVRHGFEHLQDFDAALKHATSIQEDAPWRPESILQRGLKWASAYS